MRILNKSSDERSQLGFELALTGFEIMSLNKKKFQQLARNYDAKEENTIVKLASILAVLIERMKPGEKGG